MVKKLLIFLIIGIPVSAEAALTTRICEADGITPFDNRPIMVGTKLTIIVTSDNSDWPLACDLALFGDNSNYGRVLGRDWNDVTLDYEGSHFPAAGGDAFVTDWIEEGIDGISMYNGTNPPAVAGDWFIVDYRATAVGECNVGFFENFAFEPSWELSFIHVPTRDFNEDSIVNFEDFAILAYYWQQNCAGGCEGSDLDNSGSVNIEDLKLFCDYWLEKTE